MLGIFPEDVRVPIDVLGTLWRADEDEARECARMLSEWSLAEMNSDEGLMLLDLHRDYLRCRSKSELAMTEPHELETSMLRSVTAKSVGSCAHGSPAIG